LSPKRTYILMGLFLLIASALLARLGYYQLIKGQEIARQAVAMRSRQVELKEYNRGEILDRNLLPITGTQVSTALYCLPQEIMRKQGDGSFASIHGSKRTVPLLPELKQAMKSGKSFVRIAVNLTPEETARINSSQLSGVVAAPVIRRYREDGFLAHILGYCSGGQNQEE